MGVHGDREPTDTSRRFERDGTEPPKNGQGDPAPTQNGGARAPGG
ncbi:hypothetical protein [Marinactinospora rubrisoli]|uniref:Uncharacterized protein n=1 Tax=Marinactinospora rubrisoli TaxID=2715399 RepID=A0ABW2KPY4_9ACTN